MDVVKCVVSLKGETTNCGPVDGSGVLVEVSNEKCFLVSAKHVFSDQLKKGAFCGTSTVRFTPERRDGEGAQEVEVEIEWPTATWEMEVVDGEERIPDDLVVVDVTKKIGAINQIAALNHTHMDRTNASDGTGRRGVCGEASSDEGAGNASARPL